MRIALITSLVLNALLIGKILSTKEEPQLEKIVIADYPAKPQVEEANKSEIKENKPREIISPKKVSDSDDSLDVPLPHDVAEFDHLSEQMESQKRDVLINQFQIPEEKIQKHDRLRDEYFRATNKIFEKNPMDLSIADRRKLLDYEEDYHQKLLELYGKETWQKIEDYRKQYNEQILKRMRDENVPAILMAP